MGADNDIDQGTPVTIPRWQRRLPRVCGVLCGVTFLCWVSAAIAMSNRGFDITDEGFYVLSYRWWGSNPLSFTGAQYLYGPVFDFLGESIPLLRLFRLVTVVAITASFAAAFTNWLRNRYPDSVTQTWRRVGLVAITSTGGMIYAWLPQSPGYDDVAALGALASAALVLATATRVDTGRTVPAWLPALAGVIVTAQLISKWSVLTTVGLCGICAMVILSASGSRAVLRFAAWTLAGIVGSALLVHVLIVPLDQAFAGIRFVNEAAAREAESPWTRAASYVGDSWRMATLSLLLGLPLIGLGIGSRVRGLHSLLVERVPGRCLAVALAVVLGLVLVAHGWQGGPSNTVAFPASLLAFLVAVATAAGRRPVRGEHAVLVMLLLLPVAQAFGTSNAIWIVGTNAFAAWFALVVWLLAQPQRNRLALLVSWSAAVSVPVLVASIAVTGILVHPYRTTSFSADTAVAPGLSGLRVTPAETRRYEVLREAFKPWTHGRPVPILALDTMSGLIYALNGTAAGEPWTGSEGRGRSAATLEEMCRTGAVSMTNPPFLLYNRTPEKRDLEALAACGFTFPADFVEIPLRDSFPGIRAWAPEAAVRRVD